MWIWTIVPQLVCYNAYGYTKIELRNLNAAASNLLQIYRNNLSNVQFI